MDMEHLIKAVQSYPCLWDTDTEEYKTVQVKENAWRCVSKQCNISDVREAKHIWKKLRDSHRQALRKRTPGHCWKYEKLMKFLLPHLKQRSASTSQYDIQNFENTLLSVSDYDNNESENSEFSDPEMKNSKESELTEIDILKTETESCIETIGVLNSRNYKFVKMGHLIKAVQKYPCLWDTDKEEYKTAEVKENAWRCITKQFGISDVTEAKRIWKKLRDSHRQALRKTTPGRYWKYEKLMEFLLPHLKVRPGSTSQYDTQSFESSFLSESDCDNNESENSELSEPKIKIIKRNKLLEIDVLKNEHDESSTERDICTEEMITEQENGSVKTFFDSMSDMCKSLPEYLQIRVQRSVFNIIMNAREENMKTSKS